MEKQIIIDSKQGSEEKVNPNQASKSKREIILLFIKYAIALITGFLFSSTEMLFSSFPLGFALLGACGWEAPLVLLGIIASAFNDGKFSLSIVCGACVLLTTRILADLFLDNSHQKRNAQTTIYSAKEKRNDFFSSLDRLFSESIYLRVMSASIGVFFVGVFRIIEGGFRFYDLFSAIFYLIATPLCVCLFYPFFAANEKTDIKGRTPSEERSFYLSVLAIFCALILSIKGISFLGISIPLFIGISFCLFALKRGLVYGIASSILIGVSISPSYAPMLAFVTLCYYLVSKLSLLGGAIGSCIVGLLYGIYTSGLISLSADFPALLSAPLVFSAAERFDLINDFKKFITSKENTSNSFSNQLILAERRINIQDEKIKSISDSFSSLSEIFYNLSSQLKRPSMLDLHSICEESFEKHCDGCENRPSCFGAEYPITLDAIKKSALSLHSFGKLEDKKLPDAFKKKCLRSEKIIDEVNLACSIATKKAFQNEKTEIFALDYDAISNILNDAIAENESEGKLDTKMGRQIAKAIDDAGYGNHSIMVLGKRKLKIIARNLDLNENARDISSLKSTIEGITQVKLSDPTFELSFGSVNMLLEAQRAFSADCAFARKAGEGESICGDTVSIFENKNDYLYAIISDGMGTGKKAAANSEMCNAFLCNMLNAGNKIETSLRMLNSVLRIKGSKSEDECSVSIDLLQFDLYSGALSLVKSGAAPTFILRRENVFKLASPSFPIGILRSLDAKQLNVNCEDGDVVVMISDGALKNIDDCSFITNLLGEANIADEPASKIADKIVRRAKAEADLQSDDISVVVIKVKKEICNW